MMSISHFGKLVPPINLDFLLSAKYNNSMNTRQIAKVLGSRGGKKRAQNLSALQKQNIAKQGGLAKKQSQQAAQRILENFIYLEAVDALSPKRSRVKSVNNFKSPLPSISA